MSQYNHYVQTALGFYPVKNNFCRLHANCWYNLDNVIQFNINNHVDCTDNCANTCNKNKTNFFYVSY